MDVFSVLQFHLRVPALPSAHKHLFPPPPAVPPYTSTPITLAFEFPHIIQWFPPKWKITKQVKFDTQFVAQQGHDSGMGIGHITVPPSPLLAMTIAMSSYKCIFGCSSVKVEKKPAATHFFPLFPHLYCADPVPIPLGLNLPAPCTVMLGMSWADALVGWLSIGLDMAMSAVLSKYGDRLPGVNWMKGLGQRAAQSFGNAAIQAVVAAAVPDLVNQLVWGNVKNLIVDGNISLPFGLASINNQGQVQGLIWTSGEYTSTNVSIAGGLGALQDTGADDGSGITQGAGNVDSGGGEVTGMPPPDNAGAGDTAPPPANTIDNSGAGTDPTYGAGDGLAVC
jgi:hypothetical protein